MKQKYAVEVSAEVFFLADQSSVAEGRYMFAYRITIRNIGRLNAQLLARHWVVTDAYGGVQEVRGDGVVGEQPVLFPGEIFQYTSGTSLPTPMGMMAGSYEMLAEDGVAFDANIAPFELSIPRVLH